MSHQRIVPTNQDGVENRFPGREDPNDVYDRNRCRACGVPWEDHDTISAEQIAKGFKPCVGRRPPPTLFDVVEETKHKGAYG